MTRTLNLECHISANVLRADSSPPKSRPDVFLVAMIVLFLLTQAYLFHIHSFPLTRHETDGLHYIARSSGPFFQINPFHGPGYSLAIRLFRLSGPSAFNAAKTVSIVSGVLFLAASWKLFLSMTIFVAHARIALFLLTMNMAVIIGSNMILSDMIAAAFFAAGLALWLRAPRSAALHLLIAGALCAMAYLCRQIFIVSLLIPVIDSFFLLKNLAVRTVFKRFSVFLSGFLAIAGPWFYFLYKVKGSVFWSWNHLNIAFNMYRKDQGWSEFPDIGRFPDLLSVIQSDPLLLIRSWILTLCSLPGWVMRLFPVIGVFALLGLVGWIRHSSVRRKRFLTINMCYALVLSLVWIESRFMLALLPLLSLLVTDGLFQCLGWIQRLMVSQRSVPQIHAPQIHGSVSDRQTNVQRSVPYQGSVHVPIIQRSVQSSVPDEESVPVIPGSVPVLSDQRSVPNVKGSVSNVQRSVPVLFAQRLLKSDPRRTWILTIIFALIVILPSVRSVHKIYRDVPVEYQVVTDWLKTRVSSETIILAGKPHVAVLSGARNMEFRNAGMDRLDWDDFPEIIAEYSPDYLVYDERYSSKAFEQFKRMLYPETHPFPEMLQPVLTVEKPFRIVVYRILTK